MMDKVQKTIGSQCYIPSSEPFRRFIFVLTKMQKTEYVGECVTFDSVFIKGHVKLF
jgi:hypothetical protein